MYIMWKCQWFVIKTKNCYRNKPKNLFMILTLDWWLLYETLYYIYIYIYIYIYVVCCSFSNEDSMSMIMKIDERMSEVLVTNENTFYWDFCMRHGHTFCDYIYIWLIPPIVYVNLFSCNFAMFFFFNSCCVRYGYEIIRFYNNRQRMPKKHMKKRNIMEYLKIHRWWKLDHDLYWILFEFSEVLSVDKVFITILNLCLRMKYDLWIKGTRELSMKTVKMPKNDANNDMTI